MRTFLRHFIETKGPVHAVERSLEVAWRFTRGGRRLDRVAHLLESALGRHGIRMTFFVSAGVMQRHGQRIKRLHEMGHDMGSHGMFHSRMDLLCSKRQQQILKDSHRILSEAGFEVFGFRSPYLNYNGDTRRMLSDSPYRWTSGEMILWDGVLGQNDGARRLDSLCHYFPWQEKLSLPSLWNHMVDIPVSAPDDEILYERYRIRHRDAMCDAWIGVFEQIHASGELFHLLFHPERLAHIHEALGGLVKHIRAQNPAVWCPTLNELARWWQRRITWSWQRNRDGKITVEAPPESTVLLKAYSSDGSQSETNQIFRNYHLHPPSSAYPALTIGLSPRCPKSLGEFLNAEGFFVEQTDSAKGVSFFIDRADFDTNSVRRLLDEIDSCEKPLLRLWRWPNSYRSVFCLSADICAVDIRDFVDRTKHF